jgi:hypothetical protein
MKNLFTLVVALFFIIVSNAQTEKANINTSRSNIKNKVTVPVDTVQQKVDHNSVRSNKSTIKKDEEDTTDRSKTKQADQNNPYFKHNASSGEMPKNQQKADHNSVRSNKSTIKEDGGNTTDSLKTKQASQNNPYFKNSTLAGEMPSDMQKANINTSRSNTKSLAKPADSLNNSEASTNKAKKVRFKAGAELSDKVN